MDIIKTVGMDMVKWIPIRFASDCGACLPSASFPYRASGIHNPHQTTAIMGVGTSRRISSVNWRIALEMVYAWVLTFPGCGLIGYLMAKLFMAIF